MKYIIIREADGSEFPHFCVAPFKHIELLLMLQAYRPGRTAVAAGFVRIESSRTSTFVTTFGHSESLNLGPRPDDTALISAHIVATLQLAGCAFA